MNIILAHNEDAEDIYKLQKIAFNHMVEQYGYEDVKEHIPPVTQGLVDFLDNFSKFTYLKCVVDDRIVGSVRAGMEGETCLITRLMVHPSYHKMGIGTKLMDEIEKLFSHCKRFEIFTGTRCDATIRMYEKRGYEQFKTADGEVFLQKQG